MATTKAILTLFCAGAILCTASAAASGAERPTVWDLVLGDAFPRCPRHHNSTDWPAEQRRAAPQRLSDWSALDTCFAEADGLREVYIEYDKTAEAADWLGTSTSIRRW